MSYSPAAAVPDQTLLLGPAVQSAASRRSSSPMPLRSHSRLSANTSASAQTWFATTVGQSQCRAGEAVTAPPTIQSGIHKPLFSKKLEAIPPGTPVLKSCGIVLHGQLQPIRAEASPTPRLTAQMSRTFQNYIPPSPPSVYWNPPGIASPRHSAPSREVTQVYPGQFSPPEGASLPSQPSPMSWVRSRVTTTTTISYSRMPGIPLTARSEHSRPRAAGDAARARTPPRSARLRYLTPGCNAARLDHVRKEGIATSCSSTQGFAVEGNASLKAPPVNYTTGWRFINHGSSATPDPPSLQPGMGSQGDLHGSSTYLYEHAYPAKSPRQLPKSRSVHAGHCYMHTPPLQGTASIPQASSRDASHPPVSSRLIHINSDACISGPGSCEAQVCHAGTSNFSESGGTPRSGLQHIRTSRVHVRQDEESRTTAAGLVTSCPPRQADPSDFSAPNHLEAASESILSGGHASFSGNHLEAASESILSGGYASFSGDHLEAASERILSGGHARFSGVGEDRVLMLHVVTDKWQGHGECAPGLNSLHASMHETFNSMPGVKCYSLYASWSQTNPNYREHDTFRVLNLGNNMPSGKDSWHSMSVEDFTTNCKHLEDETRAYIQEIETREGKLLNFLISHDAFVSAMAAAKTAQRCRREGNTRLRHFSFVIGSVLQMYIKEEMEHHKHPMRFLKLFRDQDVFTGDSATAGVWVAASDLSAMFLKCFPFYPEGKLHLSRVGVNQKIFFPKGTTVARDLAKHIHDKDSAGKLSAIKRLVTVVGKFADWNRDHAVLYGVARYEKMFPDLGTVVVSGVSAGDVGQYKRLARQLDLQRTFVIDGQRQEALADLFSMSEVGISISYWQPFARVFIECMACGTPAIGAGSRGQAELIAPDMGTLLQDEEEWRTESGICRLGERFAATVAQALREDWKGKSKGKSCVPFVKENFSVPAQCQGMLDSMVGWAQPKLIFQIGTSSWHRQGELASGSGNLHDSMHQIFNSIPGVKCYSIYPSCKQTSPDPGEDDTFRVFKLPPAIPTWEVFDPNSSHSCYSLSEEEFATCQKRLEEEVCAFMDEVESKEGNSFDFVISHHAFVNAMASVRIVEQRRRAGNLKLRHFSFVHGMELDMYIKEQDSRHPGYPIRFLQSCRDQRVFGSGDQTAGVWVRSADCRGKFSNCFPCYPKSQIALSRISANLNIFYPKGTTVSKDLAKHLRGVDKTHKGSRVKRIITFVGKFGDWKRLDAVLYAAAACEKTFPDLGTVIVGSGPLEAVAKYEGLARSLRLERVFFVGTQGQDAVADLLSMSEVGVFPFYEEPLGAVFVECMACGTPTIGTASGAPGQLVTSSLGMLLEEEAAWRTGEGIRRLGKRLAASVTQALREEWKGKSKGPNCVPFVKANFSMHSQCQVMLSNMMKWASRGPQGAHYGKPPLLH